ncbi:MAG: DMT family transporter [Proteobacteria bacterium]|nr:DMT family transporter [Pseudomonadota bacterium]
MPAAPSTPLLLWLTPSLTALLLYGVGQGLVKKYIGEVPPARFCLYFVLAKAIVNLGFYFTQDHPSLLAADGREFVLTGILAYLFDGTGWILYFESIVAGPITIVGTLSAAYPALTVVFAHFFLGEELNGLQYLAVTLVIGGCLGLSYSPAGSGAKITSRRWIPLSLLALTCWATAQTIVKHSYSLAGSSEVTLALCNTIGGAVTLGSYGLLRGVGGRHSMREYVHSLWPMGMMAGGDLGVIIASKHGPISIVTPLTGAYPLVTLVFAALALKERVTALQYACVGLIIVGMVLCPP